MRGRRDRPGRGAASLVETWSSEYNGATDCAHAQPLPVATASRAARLRAGGPHRADAPQSDREAIREPRGQGAAVGRHPRGVRSVDPVHRGGDVADGGARRGAARVPAPRGRLTNKGDASEPRRWGEPNI